MITQQELKEFLHYNPENGIFTRISDDKTQWAKDSKGYCQIYIKGTLYLAHKLAFLYIENTWPDCVDHIDQKPTNNCWRNLRSCTMAENQWNAKIRTDNTTGVKGLVLTKIKGSLGYRTHIQKNKKKYRAWFNINKLGKDKAYEQAVNWLIETRKELHGNFYSDTD